MKKSILNLGAQELSKSQKKSINGGLISCGNGYTCPTGQCCVKKNCRPCL